MLVALDMENFILQMDQKPVSTSILLQSGSEMIFNNDGIFSPTIFGSTPIEQKKKFGYINLGCLQINPIMFKMLITMDEKVKSIIFQTKKYSLNNKGVLVYDSKGRTGISFFKELIDEKKFNFRVGDSEIRKKKQDFIMKNIDKLFINKYPIIPVQYRMYSVMNGRLNYPEINEYYLRLINLSNNTIKNDLISQQIQKTLYNLYEFIRSKIGKKSGITRSKVLGKRVHYSQRGVIIPNPNIQFNQASIPYKILLKIFEPFVLYHLRIIDPGQNLVKYREQIRQISENKIEDIPYIRKACKMQINNKLVVLKRDPALHMGSWMAFEPTISDNDGIGLHPDVVVPFNADFDGDQMAVYALLSNEAINDARNNMYRKFKGYRCVDEQMFSLQKDYIAGLYLLTMYNKKFPKTAPRYNPDKKYDVFDVVEYDGIITTYGRIVFNEKVNVKKYNIDFLNENMGKKPVNKLIEKILRIFGSDEYQRVVDDLKELSRYYSTLINFGMQITDFTLPENLEKELNELKKIKDIQQYQEKRQELLKKIIDYHKSIESDTFVMTDSGAGKGWSQQPSQLLLSKGIVGHTDGSTFITPSNFSNGLRPDEYFKAGHSQRKGIINRTMTIAETGYLNRQMTYQMQSVLIDENNHDCKTQRQLKIDQTKDNMPKLIGRYLYDNNNNLIKITQDNYMRFVGKEIKLRSPIYCQSKDGICLTCYGDELYKQHRSKSIGVVAQSALGEPLSQNIMKAFHKGGQVSNVDIDVIKELRNNTEYSQDEIKNFITINKRQIKNKKMVKIILDYSNIIHHSDQMVGFTDDELYKFESDIFLKLTYLKMVDSNNKPFNLVLQYPSILKMNLHKDFQILPTNDEDQQLYISKNFVEIDSDLLLLAQWTDNYELQIKRVKQVLQGSMPMKSVKQLVNYIQNEYQTSSDLSWVHIEVLISQMLRDKNDPSIPQRLGNKFQPVIKGLKSIPLISDPIYAQNFENVEKALFHALITDKDLNFKNPLNKIIDPRLLLSDYEIDDKSWL